MNTLICLLAVGVGHPPANEPLCCPAPVAARGEVKGGPPLAHTFELIHSGAAGTLTVTRIEAGCGCLRQSLTTGVLQPGESAKLTIEVNTLTQPDGPNRWQITVGYKIDTPGTPPRTGELLLQITATLTREVSVNPPQLGFSTSGAASQVLSVSDTRSKPLVVTRAAASSPHLAVEVGPHQPGKPQSVTVKLSENAPVGQTDETITLLTNDPAYPELRVPVRVLKRPAGGVVANPDVVAMRFAPGQTELSTLVQLRATDAKAVAVAGAESDHPGVTAKWSAVAGAVAVVRITVTEAAATQPGNCTVRVKLAEPAGQEVIIPVSWKR